MRIIAGEARGRRLQTLKGSATRPTADRVKESLFSILGPRCAGALVLDLYAGTGNLGLEALSRGAHKAVFVDASEAAVRVIRSNISELGYADRAEVQRSDAQGAVGRLGAAAAKFDLVFLDPPYEQGLIIPTLQAIVRAGILADSGVIIAEHSRREEVGPASELSIRRQERYGDTVLTFMQRAPDN